MEAVVRCKAHFLPLRCRSVFAVFTAASDFVAVCGQRKMAFRPKGRMRQSPLSSRPQTARTQKENARLGPRALLWLPQRGGARLAPRAEPRLVGQHGPAVRATPTQHGLPSPRPRRGLFTLCQPLSMEGCLCV